MHTVGGRELRSLLDLLAIWSCHIWLVVRIKKLLQMQQIWGFGQGLLVYPILTVDWDVKGAQWLSGRVLDSRPRGRGFDPHRRHCVVVLEQDTFILA